MLPIKERSYDYGFTPQQIKRVKKILDDLYAWAKINDPKIIEMIRQSNTRYMICYPTMYTDSNNITEPDILEDAIRRQDTQGIRGIEIAQSLFTTVADNTSGAFATLMPFSG